MPSEDPDWPRASSLLDPSPGGECTAALFGVPFQNSISPSDADRAPEAIRESLNRYSTFDADAGRSLAGVRIRDLGDLTIPNAPIEELHLAIADEIGSSTAGTAGPFIVLGGDNAITRPAARALLGDLGDRAGLITFDAHHDVRSFYAGPTNGTPVRGLIEDGLPGSAIHQIGLGAFTNSETYRKWADDQGISCITARELRQRGMDEVVGEAIEAVSKVADRIYVDVDLDVLDRAFAPGCPGSRPGGITPDELSRGIEAVAATPRVIGIDFVEFDPSADQAGVTALNAGSAVMAAISGIASRS